MLIVCQKQEKEKKLNCCRKVAMSRAEAIKEKTKPGAPGDLE